MLHMKMYNSKKRQKKTKAGRRSAQDRCASPEKQVEHVGWVMDELYCEEFNVNVDNISAFLSILDQLLGRFVGPSDKNKRQQNRLEISAVAH